MATEILSPNAPPCRECKGDGEYFTGARILPDGTEALYGETVEISDEMAANPAVAGWIAGGDLVAATTWAGNVDQTVADLTARIADLEAQLAAAAAKKPVAKTEA